jgi:hypothetical protein
MNEIIENLALEKSFEQLCEAERAEVLAEMSPEAYNQLHTLLHIAPDLDQGPGPDASLRARLLTHMAGARVTAGRRPYRLPLWQVAAAVALAVAATLFFHKPVIREIPVEVVLIQTDTVYIEKPQWQERVVWREKVVYRDQPVATMPMPTADSTPVIFTPGTSLEKEPALMQFFVQVR